MVSVAAGGSRPTRRLGFRHSGRGAACGRAVAREWRGRGVGSELLAAAIEWARERGLHKLSLGVFAHNTAAIALYRKFGFLEGAPRQAVPPGERRALGRHRNGPAA
jgi:ribosomal protein S18 acetylase RimI-like enzyme